MRFLFRTAAVVAVFVAIFGFQVFGAKVSGQETNADKLATDESADEKPDVILVVGAGGEAEYGEAFTESASQWREVADTAGANVTMIGIDGSPGESGEAGSASDLDRLKNAIAALPSQSRQDLWIVMIGHGTSSQSGSKFNLRGPDLSADQLASWLKPIERPTVIVNAFSSSAPFLNALSGKDRVVVTATQSGQEQNYSRFGDYLSRAIGDSASDIDHDGEVSILEAFLAASAAVRDFYSSENRLQTETSLIDDNGDSLGTKASAFRGIRSVAKAASADQSLDGDRAAGITLAPPAVRLPLTDEEAIERDEIEAELRRLHAGQSAMTDQEYRDAVLPKWIRLAKIYRAAEERAKPATPSPSTPAAGDEAEAKAEPPADPQPDADDAP